MFCSCRQVSVAEVERSHMVLHSMCMRAWAEDSLSVADTQSRIMALTASEDHLPDQVMTLTLGTQDLSPQYDLPLALTPVLMSLVWRFMVCSAVLVNTSTSPS